MPPKNSGGSSKFPGGHKVIHRTPQTASVRVVTPRILKGMWTILMYKLTITYILYLTKAPVQENEVLSFV